MSVIDNKSLRQYLKSISPMDVETDDLEPGQYCKEDKGRFWLRLPVLSAGFPIAQTNSGEDVLYAEDHDHYCVIGTNGDASIVSVDPTGYMVYSPIRGLNRVLENYKDLAFLTLVDGFYPFPRQPRFVGLAMEPVN